jgi:hypothetical protein
MELTLLETVGPYAWGAVVGGLAGVLLGAYVAGRGRPPEPNPWVTRLTRDWSERERWTQMGERDA